MAISWANALKNPETSGSFTHPLAHERRIVSTPAILGMVARKRKHHRREGYPIVYIALALLPALLLLTWLYTRDVWHPEPKQSVYRIFLLGAAVVLPAGLLERALLDTSFPGLKNGWKVTVATAFFVAGMVEEFLKASVVERGALDKGLMRTRIDCIVYAGAAALGFAAVENVLYVTSSGFTTALLRSVTAVPAHMMFGILMGNEFAHHVLEGKSRGRAYVIPALAHGAYDSFALAESWLADVLLVGYLIFLLEVCLRILDRAATRTWRWA
ncbi:hypothetical protein GCM10010885_01330 [Alicyclobacillus cellulosilyticus]|uniref:Protease PrsW n=2 Tax=Alicyclobacillus cellulosilyticus TaxID=1003997 RepID=A0A917K008_9BACL|nr:hypothetical protein GCM10010885_01330 [Alicyclobacillus cellulosilyticus]